MTRTQSNQDKRRDSEERFRRRLSDAATLALVHQVAGRIYRDLKLRPGRFPTLFECRGDNLSPLDTIATIESELCLFLMDNRQRLEKVLAAGGANSGSYLKKTFVNHLRDRARKRGVNPYLYLYKRAADILRKDPEFTTTAVRNRGMAFSLTAESHTITPLTEEDFDEIPFPVSFHEMRTYDAVNRKAAIQSLARHFWQEVARLWNDQAVRVDLRDLIDWITIHVPVGPEHEKKFSRALPEDEGSCRDLLDTVADDRYRPDRLYFDPGLVRKWANKFCARLNARQKEILLLKHEGGLGLDAIAQRTGYSSASGVKYTLKGTEQQLRDFLRDLPWLSPDSRGEVNQAAFSLFMETLLDKLKKDRAAP